VGRTGMTSPAVTLALAATGFYQRGRGGSMKAAGQRAATPATPQQQCRSTADMLS